MALGRSDRLETFALACQHCNGYRYNFTMATDPYRQTTVPLLIRVRSICYQPIDYCHSAYGDTGSADEAMRVRLGT
jgi:hypothetical protein